MSRPVRLQFRDVKRNFISFKRDGISLYIFSIVSLVAYGALLLIDRRAGTLRGEATPQTIGAFLLAFAAYAGAVLWLERGGRWSAGWAWGTAVFSRLLLLFTTPSLSDDVYRYIWDGHVATNGVSPYAFAVNDAALDYLAIPERALVNNAWMASPYMPAAQALFAAAALIGRQPVLMQMAMATLDLAAAAVIAGLLRFAALPAQRLLLVLWNPLVVVEAAHGAHVDAWMVLLALLAVQATLKKPSSGYKSVLAPLYLALATLTKLLPAVLSPVLFWRWSWFQRLLYPIVTLLVLLPFGLHAGWGVDRSLSGRGLFGAFLIYSSQWRFNSAVFFGLEKLLGGGESVTATAAAKVILAAGMLLVLLVVFLLARKFEGPRGTLRLCSVPLMAYILFTPTFHPWYLLLLLAFVPFLPPGKEESGLWWLAALPWLWLSGTAVFSYLAYLDPAQVVERPWVRLMQWLPALLLLVVASVMLARERLLQSD